MCYSKKYKEKNTRFSQLVSTCLLSLVGTAYPIMNMFQVNNKNNQNYLVKTVLVPHDKVLTGINFIAPKGKVSALDT